MVIKMEIKIPEFFDTHKGLAYIYIYIYICVCVCVCFSCAFPILQFDPGWLFSLVVIFCYKFRVLRLYFSAQQGSNFRGGRRGLFQ